MHYYDGLMRSKIFTEDLGPYMEKARDMYPGGRYQRFLRGFDRIFILG